MSFDFFPDEVAAAELNAARHPSIYPEAAAWDNFGSGAGRYAMRSLAEVGRAVDMLGAVGPIALDAVTGGTERQEQYFREHDEVFNRAVDYWTPGPGEVGIAGQIVGQLGGGVLQALASPALLVGTAQLSTAEDLVRQGVDAGAANVVGDVAGLGMAVGVKLPYLGNTLASRAGTGAAGNVLQGMAVAGASHEILMAAGNQKVATQYDALDVKSRILDGLLGAAFGGLAHIEARTSPTDQAALLVANQARHMEETTAPGRPVSDADVTQHVDAMRQAVDQVLRGEPVAVDEAVKGMLLTPDSPQLRAQAEVVQEMRRLAAEEAPIGGVIPPRVDPPTVETLAVVGTLDHATTDPAALNARRIVIQYPDAMIPTGQVDPTGAPILMRAAEAITKADADVAHSQATARNLFATAANCLLGAL